MHSNCCFKNPPSVFLSPCKAEYLCHLFILALRDRIHFVNMESNFSVWFVVHLHKAGPQVSSYVTTDGKSTKPQALYWVTGVRTVGHHTFLKTVCIYSKPWWKHLLLDLHDIFSTLSHLDKRAKKKKKVPALWMWQTFPKRGSAKCGRSCVVSRFLWCGERWRYATLQPEIEAVSWLNEFDFWHLRTQR